MKVIKIAIANGLVASIATMSIMAAYGIQDFKGTLSAEVEKATKGGANVVQGKEGWLFFVPELRHLSVGPFWGENAVKVSKATTPAAADPLPAIMDFKAQLDKAGIKLLIVPVPAKAAIYPEKLAEGTVNSAGSRLDASDSEFIGILKQRGVDVIDLAPAYTQYRSEHPDHLLYSKEDTHWSGYGIGLAADLIAKKVEGESWVSGVNKTKFSGKTAPANLTGDLVEMMTGTKPGPEAVTLTTVTDSKGATAQSWRESPMLLLGDSHDLIYSIGGDMLATGAGLPENLALKLGFAPDVVAVRGSGATPARVNLARRGDNLAGKKMVIWCFSVREFTEGQGWKNVPVIR